MLAFDFGSICSSNIFALDIKCYNYLELQNCRKYIRKLILFQILPVANDFWSFNIVSPNILYPHDCSSKFSVSNSISFLEQRAIVWMFGLDIRMVSISFLCWWTFTRWHYHNTRFLQCFALVCSVNNDLCIPHLLAEGESFVQLVGIVQRLSVGTGYLENITRFLLVYVLYFGCGIHRNCIHRCGAHHGHTRRKCCRNESK